MQNSEKQIPCCAIYLANNWPTYICRPTPLYFSEINTLSFARKQKEAWCSIISKQKLQHQEARNTKVASSFYTSFQKLTSVGTYTRQRQRNKCLRWLSSTIKWQQQITQHISPCVGMMFESHSQLCAQLQFRYWHAQFIPALDTFMHTDGKLCSQSMTLQVCDLCCRLV